MSNQIEQIGVSEFGGSTDADLLWDVSAQGGWPEKRLWAALFRDACEELGIIRTDNQRVITFEEYRETVEWIRERSKEVGGSYYVIETVFERITPEEIFEFVETYRCECCDHLVMLYPCRNAIGLGLPSTTSRGARHRETQGTTHKKLRKYS